MKFILKKNEFIIKYFAFENSALWKIVFPILQNSQPFTVLFAFDDVLIDDVDKRKNRNISFVEISFNKMEYRFKICDFLFILLFIYIHIHIHIRLFTLFYFIIYLFTLLYFALFYYLFIYFIYL